MNQIYDPPNEYDAGLDFNYSVWTADTDITLTNVPWDSDYRNVVMFDSTNAFNRWIDQSATDNTQITNASYAKADQPISLSIPFNQAQRFNYVRVYNPAQPVIPGVGGFDVPRYFYYFILNTKYVAPNTTEIQVQLDVFQTYIRSVQFGRCYIERGHLGIANSENFRNYGRDYLTVPEGLDTGSNYFTVARRGESQIITSGNSGHSILVASTIKLEQSPGTKAKPNLDTAEGGFVQGLPSGASYYLFTSDNDFMAFMRKYSKYPWITQGIISITVIPPWRRYYNSLGSKLSIGAYKMPAAQASKAKRNIFLNWRDNSTIRNYIPVRYRHLKKFYTFPYMAIEITAFNGQSSILRPELWHSKDAMIDEEVSLLPPNQRLSWHPNGYNHDREPSLSGDDVGNGIDHAVSLGNFPALALVNDGAILAMANTANTTAFGYQSADWSQQRALRANEVSYDQATAGIGASNALTGIGMNADASSTAIGNQLAQDSSLLNAIGGTATGAGMGAFAGPLGAAAGGVGGAASGVMGMLNTGNQINASNAQLANRLSASSASQGVNSGLAGQVRDSNKGLADWAAKGDYENTIAGLNARTRDMELTPPSTVGMQGGETLGILNFRFGFQFRWLMPDQASIQSIGEYWLRYGYSIQRFGFLPPSLMVMEKFTYWKLKETFIGRSPIPELFKQAIRGIFEKGVTVWANPDDIGFTDPADNEALPGIVIDGYVPPETEPEPEPEPPTPEKKRKHKMIVYGTVSTVPGFEGNLWALAGSSPGTPANWLETDDIIRSNAFLDATGQESSVGLTEEEFNTMREAYLAALEIAQVGGEPVE